MTFLSHLQRTGISLFILCTYSCPLALSQSPNTQDNTGPQRFQKYLHDKESVNLATGALNLSIPLLHLPGRAGHDLDFTVSYNNQSLLSIGLGAHPVPSPAGSTIPYVVGVTQYEMGWNTGSGSTYGWSTSIPSATFAVLANNTDPSVPALDSSCFGSPTLTDPQGQQMTFGLAMFGCSAGLSPTNTLNYGPMFTAAADDQGNDVVADLGAPAGPTFFYPDGTRLVIPSAPSGQNLQELLPTTMIHLDRNGNAITYSPNTITDTLGRQITVNWPSTGRPSAALSNLLSESSIGYLNSNGQPETITFLYGGSPAAPSGTLDRPGIGTQFGSTAGYGTANYLSSPNAIYINYDGVNGTYGNDINISQMPLSAIVLPSGLTYTFQYDAYGDLIKITYPTGGYTRYDYQKLLHGSAQYMQFIQQIFQQDVMQVVGKHVCTAAATPLRATAALPGNTCPVAEELTTYTPSSATVSNNWTVGNTSSTVVNPDGTTTVSTYPAIGPAAPRIWDGVLQSTYQAASEIGETTTSSTGATMRTIANQYAADNAHLLSRTTTLDNGNTITEQWTYQPTPLTGVNFTNYPIPGTSANAILCAGYCNYTANASNQYSASATIWNPMTYTIMDWSGQVMKKVVSEWATPSFDPARPFLPAQKLVESTFQGASGTLLSQSRYTYDDYSSYPLVASNAVQHGMTGASFNTANTARGNLTQLRKWRNTDNTWITSYVQYDDTGNAVRSIDPNGNTTSYSFADGWQDMSCTPSSGSGNAYPTAVTNAYGQSMLSTYNSCTGMIATSTDANSQTTAYVYDAYDRVIDVVYPETYPGTSSHAETKTCYSDSGTCSASTTAPIYTIVSSKISPSVWSVSEVDLDGIGRKSKELMLSDPYGVMEVDTFYDRMERISSMTNPFRPSQGGTSGSTGYLYDSLGRKVMESKPDGHQSTWSYSGKTSYATDETGRTWTHVLDALDRVVEVLEPDPGGLDTVATQYQYDSLGNLLRVDQWGGPVGSSGERYRNFSYDSLSQLVTAYNPEAGGTCYGQMVGGACLPGYDNNGNLITKTDSRMVTTTSSYDALNRVVARSYSDGTPSACFQFNNSPIDASGANRAGKLLSEWTQIGICPSGTVSAVPAGALNYRTVNAYDAKGRIINESECPSKPCTVPYNFPYSYDTAGSLIGWSGGVSSAPTFTSSVDAAGRLSSVNSVSAGGQQVLFRADSVTATTLGIPYGPFGLLQAERSINPDTNVAALSTSRTFDNRGRILAEQDRSATANVVPGSQSTGTIALTLNEQSVIVPNSGTHSTGTFTINGSDQAVTPCPSNAALAPGCLDFGVFTFIIVDPNSTNPLWQYTVFYNNGLSASSLASMVATRINADPYANVTAAAAGNVVTVTSIAVGAQTNFILASNVTSITTQNTSSTVVNGPSFAIATSGSTMTGGSTGSTSTIYDSGTINATIGTTTASVPWGQSSTAASVTTALASAIQSGSGGALLASASGSAVNVASTGVGALQNMAITVNVTHDSAHFWQQSLLAFSAGMSGGVSPSLYGFTIPSDGTGYSPNGDLVSVNDTVMGTWTYGYDQINRITAATASSGAFSGSTIAWTYDAWGNRLSQTPNPGGGSLPLPQSFWSTYDTSNRIIGSSIPGTGAGFGYTAAGHVTYDGLNQYFYDGDGRLCAAVNTVTSAGTGYTYDAEGIRVTRGQVSSASCPGASNYTPAAMYLVDLSGQQVTELSSNGTWQHSNVFAQGKLIATYDQNGTHFHFTDILGTRRAQASSSGVLEETCTSLPFGDQLSCVQTATSTADDATEQHFTGKERDAETGLDYFGARYYSSTSGRFISPDWSSSTVPVPYAELQNPQTLNLYAYVQNNPITHEDLTGHGACRHPGEISCQLGPTDEPNYIEPSGDANCGGCSVSQDEHKYNETLRQQNVIEKLQKAAAQQHGVAAKARYKTMNGAAIGAEKAALDATDKAGRKYEYGGWILKDKDGNYTYTNPTTFNDESHFYPDSETVPKGFSGVADYHTHPHTTSSPGPGLSAGDEQHAYDYHRTGFEADTYSRNMYRFTPGVTPYKPNEYCCGTIGDFVTTIPH